MIRAFLCAAAFGVSVLLSNGSASADAPTSVADTFAPRQLNQYVLEIEAALARAQARLGVIPEEAAAEITRYADVAYVPTDALSEEYGVVRHRMVALLNVWRRAMDPAAAEYVHYGATTVDIYDTARMLQARRSILLFIEDLRALELQLIELAREHRDTPMIGRTLAQHALPMTFGKKISVWIGENRRHIERLTDLLHRVERSAIMKGAVGSYLGLGEHGIAIEAAFAEELGMAPPYPADWHGARDVFAEYAGVLALISRSYGRFGQEILLLQATDIGEVVEMRPSSAVSSSTMPHKNNPSLSEALVFRARVIPRLAEVVQDDMINFFERDNTSRTNRVLEEISLETELMLRDASRLIDRLEINAGRMRANLDRTDGMIMGQRIVFALAETLGRESAEALVRESAARALDQPVSFREALLQDDAIRSAISDAELDALLDPETYLGLAAEQVDAVIAEALAARANDPDLE